MAGLPLPKLTLKSTLDYVALAAGIAIGFAIWQPVFSGLEDSLKKNGGV